MEPVIVDSSFGNFVVYRATINNAKKILACHIDAIDPKALEIYKSNKKALNKTNILQVINKIIAKEIGTMASKTIKITKENKQELVMYCFNNKINIKDNQANEYDFFKNFKITDLSFFANNENYDKAAEVVDEYILEQAHKYRVIQDNNWKETTKETAKIRYILEFAQELAHRDVTYELTELKDEF